MSDGDLDPPRAELRAMADAMPVLAAPPSLPPGRTVDAPRSDWDADLPADLSSDWDSTTDWHDAVSAVAEWADAATASPASSDTAWDEDDFAPPIGAIHEDDPPADDPPAADPPDATHSLPDDSLAGDSLPATSCEVDDSLVVGPLGDDVRGDDSLAEGPLPADPPADDAPAEDALPSGSRADGSRAADSPVDVEAAFGEVLGRWARVRVRGLLRRRRETVVPAEGDDAGAVEDDEGGEDDYDVYDAPSPMRSGRDAWLGVAWVLVFTALFAWATHLWVDRASNAAAQGQSAKLDDMRAVEPIPGVTTSTGDEGPRKIKVSVIKPETLGGRATSSEYQPEPPYYMSALADGEIVSGAYGEFASKDFVLMSAVTSANLLYPDSQIGVLLDQLQDDDPNLIDLLPVPAGTLGGIARCGESKFADQPKAVCFWADEQCMGVLTWIDQPLSKAMEEFLPLREQIEHQL
jgi:hypothetical protein